MEMSGNVDRVELTVRAAAVTAACCASNIKTHVGKCFFFLEIRMLKTSLSHVDHIYLIAYSTTAANHCCC